MGVAVRSWHGDRAGGAGDPTYFAATDRHQGFCDRRASRRRRLSLEECGTLTMTPGALLKKALPFAISALALGVVFSVTDLDPLIGLQRRLQWHELPLVAILVIAI